MCRWNVRFTSLVTPPTLARSRASSSPPLLRRTGALGERGILEGWPNYIPSTQPRSATKKTLPSEKKVAPKRTVIKKAPARNLQRVIIPFPPMNAPFGGARHYDSDRKVATLTVNFRNEHKDPELQNLRAVLTHVEKTLSKLVELLEPTMQLQDAISPLRSNTFIHPGKYQEVNGGPDRPRWPDYIKLKMYPNDVKFTAPDGTIIDPAGISFADYDVQPTVELRDV